MRFPIANCRFPIGFGSHAASSNGKSAIGNRQLLALLVLLLTPTFALAADRKPNVLFILTDDMGPGDLSIYGGKQGATPNLDRLAAEGTRFNQFYTASPICSPSRVAYTTGMYPARWRINSFLHERKGNAECDQVDFLDPKAPTTARAMKSAGYATAHFGKWHMGGGRDVQDAPLPSAYGFDESHVNREGMGPRFETFGSATMPEIYEGKPYFRYEYTRYWVDRSIDFMKRNREKPFYLELWPQDVHTPHTPSEESLQKIQSADLPKPQKNFRAVLNEYDHQMGRLLDALREMKLAENTIVIFAADNGPEPSFEHARTLGRRGMKWSLYEGGIREPLLVRWPGHVPAGRVDETTVLCSIDLQPTLLALTGLKPTTNDKQDGSDMSPAWLGKPMSRPTPLFWEYGRKPNVYLYPKPPGDKSPNLAIRDGDWKLLINADGTGAELYQLSTDSNETKNLASEHPDITRRLSELVLAWRKSLP